MQYFHIPITIGTTDGYEYDALWSGEYYDLYFDPEDKCMHGPFLVTDTLQIQFTDGGPHITFTGTELASTFRVFINPPRYFHREVQSGIRAWWRKEVIK